MLRPGMHGTEEPVPPAGPDTDFRSLLNSYIPKDNSLQSETVHYKRGVCQQFCLPSHTVDPSQWAEEEVSGSGTRQQVPGRRRRNRDLGPHPDYSRPVPCPPCSETTLSFSPVTPSHP